MKLGRILSNVSILKTSPESLDWQQIEVKNIQNDSRSICEGDVFVAIQGHQTDGHQFVSLAETQGACACIVETLQTGIRIPQIQVSSSPAALSQMAANFYDHPSSHLLLCGITGTNGKTTTSFLVETLLSAAYYQTGMLGTIFYRYKGHVRPAPLTTPGSLELQKMLHDMDQIGVSAVSMEVSSHALSLHRLDGIFFQVAAFTNLSQDHLDFHHTMEDYFLAKTRLFHEHLKSKEQAGYAVICVDDIYGQRLAQSINPKQLIVVSTKVPDRTALEHFHCPSIIIKQADFSLSGIYAILSFPHKDVVIESKLCGEHNLENIAIAAGIGWALQIDPDLIASALSSLEGIPGRLERVIVHEEQPTVFIDYAHTPDALSHVLQTLRASNHHQPIESSRIFVVFGCGGDRDQSKRKQMGQIADEYADIVILTSDNPRTEDPEKILRMIQEGMCSQVLTQEKLSTAAKGFIIESDRKKAISIALLSATKNDVVLIAGKGHEDYQMIGNQKYPFDDKKEVISILSSNHLWKKPL